MLEAMRLRCAGYGEKATIADGLKGAAWILGSAVVITNPEGHPLERNATLYGCPPGSRGSQNMTIAVTDKGPVHTSWPLSRNSISIQRDETTDEG